MGLMGTEMVPSIDNRRIEGTGIASLFGLDERCAALVGTGGFGFDGPATGPLAAPNRSFIALTDTGPSSFPAPDVSTGFPSNRDPLFDCGVWLATLEGLLGPPVEAGRPCSEMTDTERPVDWGEMLMGVRG